MENTNYKNISKNNYDYMRNCNNREEKKSC